MTEPPFEKIDARAPRDGEFFRVNPDPEYQIEVVVTRDENGELYLIADHMVPNVQRIAPGKLEHCMMFLARNKDNEMFIWLVPLPVPDDHPAYLAMNDWICIRGMH